MSSGSRRSDNTFLGYAIVLGALIALVVLITVVVDSGRSEQIPTVDYTPDALTLSEIAPYQAYAPDQDQLPEGWTPTSSRLNDGGALTEEEPTEPVRWSVGFATPEDRHAAFHISDADPDAFIAEVTMRANPTGSRRSTAKSGNAGTTKSRTNAPSCCGPTTPRSSSAGVPPTRNWRPLRGRWNRRPHRVTAVYPV